MKEGLWPKYISDRSLRKPLGDVKDDKEIFGSGRAFGNGIFSVKAAFYAALLEVKRKGAIPKYIICDLVFPIKSDEKEAKEKVKILRSLASDFNLKIASITGETSKAVISPQIHIIISGEDACLSVYPEEGDSIRIVGYTGLMGSLMLLDEAGEELGKRFSKNYLNALYKEEKYLALDAEDEAKAYHLAGESIFTGLWNFAEECGLGININMEDIPIRQGTVEICEYLNINPYELRSEGLIIVSGGKSGVKIGNFTKPPKKIIMRGEDESFLSKPAGEEYARWIGGIL